MEHGLHGCNGFSQRKKELGVRSQNLEGRIECWKCGTRTNE